MSNTKSNVASHKTCTGTQGCGELLPLGFYANDKSKKDGKRNLCKGCQRQYRNSPIGIQRRLDADRKYQKKPMSRFRKYQRSAKERGYTWDMTFEQFMTFWQLPCTHCNAEIETIGLDRVDSNKPYEISNLESCCPKCNQMKSDYSTVDWYSHMNKILAFRMSKMS